MRTILLTLLIFVSFTVAGAQIPIATQVQILKVEDSRRYDAVLEGLMKSPNAAVRVRAALAAGRIGDAAAVPVLIRMLNDRSEKVREMAAFALGETESIEAADAIRIALGETARAQLPGQEPANVRGRLVEAAGKIVAANVQAETRAVASVPDHRRTLGEAIVFTLERELQSAASPNKETILLALTAALRARPEKAEVTVQKFLASTDPDIVAAALNTLSRLRAKNANKDARDLLETHTHAVVRANAARLLGAAEDKEAVDLLIKAATKDVDSRVRVSAIRSLAALRDQKAAQALLLASGPMLADLKTNKSEVLEIATALGRILENTSHQGAITFLESLRKADNYSSAETEIAFARIAPRKYLDWQQFKQPAPGGFIISFPSIHLALTYPDGISAFAQGLSEIVENRSKVYHEQAVADAKKTIGNLYGEVRAAGSLFGPEFLMRDVEEELRSEVGDVNKLPESEKPAARTRLAELDKAIADNNKLLRKLVNGYPDVLRALAKAKPDRYEKDLAELLIEKQVAVVVEEGGKKRVWIVQDESEDSKKAHQMRYLHKDVSVRATAAELIGDIADLPSTGLLIEAFDFAVANDRDSNDAQLAILDALAKQKVFPLVRPTFEKALASPDALVRLRAVSLIKQNEELKKLFPAIDPAIGVHRAYSAGSKTKNGQVLNTDADYERAASRKNGSISAVFTTQKGTFTIEFLPEDAPLTVDNFVKLARAGYFNGLEVHRVVPNFVMQDGDPRGDGNGGPGWSIRCELNMVPFERGAVGMALSGKDTGGSQWFVTHSPQPHLDGGYTVFGKVNSKGMEVVDKIVRGDKILSVRIVGR